jgi:hypothetical protein
MSDIVRAAGVGEPADAPAWDGTRARPTVRAERLTETPSGTSGSGV